MFSVIQGKSDTLTGGWQRIEAGRRSGSTSEASVADMRMIERLLAEPLRQLDMRLIGLSSVNWATGYKFDFSWIDLPVLDRDGHPKHNRGIASQPGVYFLGLPWLSKMNSSFLSRVGDDAARIADCIERAADQRSMATSIELQ
jgi:hypothetical protein